MKIWGIVSKICKGTEYDAEIEVLNEPIVTGKIENTRKAFLNNPKIVTKSSQRIRSCIIENRIDCVYTGFR